MTRRDAPEPSSGRRAGCAALALAPIPPASRLPTPPCPSPSASLPRSAPSSSSVSCREVACRCIRAPSTFLPVMLTSRNYSLAFENLFFRSLTCSSHPPASPLLASSRDLLLLAVAAPPSPVTALSVVHALLAARVIGPYDAVDRDLEGLATIALWGY